MHAHHARVWSAARGACGAESASLPGPGQLPQPERRPRTPRCGAVASSFPSQSECTVRMLFRLRPRTAGMAPSARALPVRCLGLPCLPRLAGPVAGHRMLSKFLQCIFGSSPSRSQLLQLALLHPSFIPRHCIASTAKLILLPLSRCPHPTLPSLCLTPSPGAPGRLLRRSSTLRDASRAHHGVRARPPCRALRSGRAPYG